MDQTAGAAVMVPLGDVSGLAEGDMQCFPDIGRYGVVVFRVDGGLFAVEDGCPTCESPLGTGELRSHQLICPGEHAHDLLDAEAEASGSLALLMLDGPEHALRVAARTR